MDLKASPFLRLCFQNDKVSPIYCYFINEWLLKHDPKLDELIDWDHKKDILEWLDTL